MGKLCTDFANSQDETKFELCDTIRIILRSYPKSSFDEENECEWMPMLQQGLHDILFSRLGKTQRDPAMMLVASVIEVSDFNWCLNTYEPGWVVKWISVKVLGFGALTLWDIHIGTNNF